MTVRFFHPTPIEFTNADECLVQFCYVYYFVTNNIHNYYCLLGIRNY